MQNAEPLRPDVQLVIGHPQRHATYRKCGRAHATQQGVYRCMMLEISWSYQVERVVADAM